MTISIHLELPDDIAAALTAYAKAEGVSKRTAAVTFLATGLGLVYAPPQNGGWKGSPNSLAALNLARGKRRKSID